jgi:hypothetical protein
VVCGWMERMDREIGAIGTCMRWKDMVVIGWRGSARTKGECCRSVKIHLLSPRIVDTYRVIDIDLHVILIARDNSQSMSIYCTLEGVEEKTRSERTAQ